MTTNDFAITEAELLKNLSPFSHLVSTDVSVLLQFVAVIGVGVFIGWLLIEAAKLVARYFILALSGSIKPRQVFFNCVFIPVAIFAGHMAYFSGDPDGRYVMFVASAGAVVALLLCMWIETRERPNVFERLILTAPSRPFSPTPEASRVEVAPTTIHDDWADIALELKKENGNV